MSYESWDPGHYEPEPNLAGGYRSPPTSALSDQKNSWIFYALQEFYANLSAHEVSIGRELLAPEKLRHIRKFEGSLLREYGASRPDEAWLSRHEGWVARNSHG